MADIYTTILYGDGKECPKKERCKYGDICKQKDTFKGEHICFERKAINLYEDRVIRYRNNGGKKNDY